ncbi:MAG: hypothetical protein KGJ68_13815 [Gammaproteobacteria bacterium]|nr:hypothetical protein [Gammaproteobacteria bacterium]
MPEERPGEPRAPAPRRAAVLGLLVTLLLVVLGLVLVKVLRDSGRLEDCELSGRTNCAPIDARNGDSS